MRKFIITGTLLLIATPAFAARHPVQDTSTPRIDPASIPAYAAEAHPVEPVRRHRHGRGWVLHQHRHSAKKFQESPPRHSHRMAGHSRKEARREADPPKTAKPRSAVDPRVDPPKSILEASILDDTDLGFEGEADGMAMPHPQVVTNRPYHIIGKIRIADAEYDFASGGSGRGSIPYGDFPITPDDVGHWGKRHGALGINGNEIYDGKIKDTREGIEIHAAHHKRSAGCIAIEQYEEAKSAILRMIKTAGSAFIHIWPGIVSITPQRSVGRTMIAFYKHVDDPEESNVHESHNHKHEHKQAHNNHERRHVAVRHHERHRHYAHHRSRHYARA